MPLHALIFDVDGTLAETEELHREAFNQTFNEFDLPWHWDQDRYRALLKITGGKERMLAHAASLGIDDFDPLPLHKRKTALYNERLAQGAITLRPGVEALIREAVELKPERHEFIEKPGKVVRFMSMTGG